MNKSILFIISMMMLFLSACSEKNDAVTYVEELSSELLSCTNMEQYDAVYDKIIAIDEDVRFTAQPGQTQEEKAAIIKASARLIHEALAVKAILYVMPEDVVPTKEDIRQLTEECIDKKLNVVNGSYSEVRSLVKAHFGLPL